MRVRSCVLLLILLGWGHRLSADAIYRVTNLGTLGGSGTQGFAINNAGQITGVSSTSTGSLHAFLYSGGQMTDLGTLGGSTSAGYGINDAGQVTGESALSTGPSHAFVYGNGHMIDLGTLGPAFGSSSVGYGINDAGQIAGTSFNSTGSSRAFLYSNGQMMDLGTLAGGFTSYGSGINNAGQVTGSSSSSSSSSHAFLFSNGQMKDLGTLAGPCDPQTSVCGVDYSFGSAINDAGQLTGTSSSPTSASETYAFLDSNGQMTDLGTLAGGSSFGYALNNTGQLVGASTSPTSIFDHHAILYSNGQMIDLDDLIDPALGITLTDARGINDKGQIVANCCEYGVSRSYLLTPIAAQVPEPDSLGLLGLALLPLLLRRALARRC
jgi:probable HAF family extracellular repeat protein